MSNSTGASNSTPLRMYVGEAFTEQLLQPERKTRFSYITAVWAVVILDVMAQGYECRSSELRSLLLERGIQEKRLVPVKHYSISGAWKLTSKPGNLSNSLVKKNAYALCSIFIDTNLSSPTDQHASGDRNATFTNVNMI
ncbi:hypothetical protein MG293_008103 [Ovis ammon polii]|uniref:Uncharacterized protein n=1 Tax=Ovis ammon polii TaxID=230172 RepID=A0AAD4U9J0_OVIAM|nr:hypothetical protein MG293_008103 [Ovis ammon polii]